MPRTVWKYPLLLGGGRQKFDVPYLGVVVHVGPDPTGEIASPTFPCGWSWSPKLSMKWNCGTMAENPCAEILINPRASLPEQLAGPFLRGGLAVMPHIHRVSFIVENRRILPNGEWSVWRHIGGGQTYEIAMKHRQWSEAEYAQYTPSVTVQHRIVRCEEILEVVVDG